MQCSKGGRGFQPQKTGETEVSPVDVATTACRCLMGSFKLQPILRGLMHTLDYQAASSMSRVRFVCGLGTSNVALREEPLYEL